MDDLLTDSQGMSYFHQSHHFGPSEFDYASQPFDPFVDCHYDAIAEQKPHSHSQIPALGKENAPPSAQFQINKPEPAPRRQNLIIWDWDDTLFPTFAFRTAQDQKDVDFLRKLRVLASFAEEVLSAMIALYGAENVVIVTNASATWIDKCLNVDIVQPIMRPFQRLLRENAIATISASTPALTAKFPNQPRMWKQIVFTELFETYFGALSARDTACVTSIGDSLCEYEAAKNASKRLPNRILHRLRLKPNPKIDDLIAQMKHIRALVPLFAQSEDDIELNFAVSRLEESNSSSSDVTC